MRKFLTAAIFVMWLVCSVASGSNALKANASAINITPPLEMKYTLGGYGERMNRPVIAVHDSIWAKILILKENNRKYAILTLDLLGLPSNVKADLIKRVASDGWTAKNMMLLPSHSHGSLEMAALNCKNTLDIPQLGIYQPQLLEFLIDKLAALIKAADCNFRPVQIGTKSKLLEGVNRNRRKDPDVDKELTVTRIDLLDGKPLAVMVNWTAHPTFLGAKDMMLSAEWPGYLQRELEHSIGNGVTAMYYNGAEGDQSAVLNENIADDYQKIQIYGKRMADFALALYNDITPVRNCLFDFQYNIIQLPEHQAHPSFMKTGGEEYGLTEGSVKTVMNILCPDVIGLGAVRIGDLIIAGIPGEMTAILGLKIKQSLRKNAIRYVAIGGLANEWISYILDKQQYLYGEGYESSMSFYGPDLGQVLSDETIANAVKLEHY